MVDDLNEAKIARIMQDVADRVEEDDDGHGNFNDDAKISEKTEAAAHTDEEAGEQERMDSPDRSLQSIAKRPGEQAGDKSEDEHEVGEVEDAGVSDAGKDDSTDGDRSSGQDGVSTSVVVDDSPTGMESERATDNDESDESVVVDDGGGGGVTVSRSQLGKADAMEPDAGHVGNGDSVRAQSNELVSLVSIVDRKEGERNDASEASEYDKADSNQQVDSQKEQGAGAVRGRRFVTRPEARKESIRRTLDRFYPS